MNLRIHWWVVLMAAHFTGTQTFAAESNSTLRLTGIVSIGQYKRAYLALEERGRTPEYLSLREGEKAGQLEVRSVDAASGRVHILRQGKDLWLTFTSQDSTERRERRAEKEFVDKHTRAHEAMQQRERERLARESAHDTK